MADASPPRGSAFAMLAGFAPWILYWILVGNAPFRVAALAALGLAAVVVAISAVRHQAKLLEWGSLIALAVLTGLAFVADDQVLEEWMQPLSNAALFLIALVSVLVGKPFTLAYARDSVTADVAASPGFLYVNTVITWLWVGAFAVMTASSVVPPLVEGDATIRDGGSTLSIVCYWVVPMSVMGLAAVASARFPDWFTSRMDGLAVDEPPPAAPLPVDGVTATAADGGVQLRLEPADALVDEPLRVVVDGLVVGAEVAVRTEAVDAAGHRWQARARFRAGGTTLDTGRDAPVEGTWDEADPAAPVWAMRFATEGAVPDIFLPPPSPWAVSVVVEVDGGPTLTATAVRRPWADGVVVQDVVVAGRPGRLVVPPGSGPHPGVVLFPGSEGGLDSQTANAAVVASHGRCALVVSTHDGDAGEALVEVPLERYADAIRWLADHPAVDRTDVAAMAISRGSEGLLGALARIDGLPVATVVAVSPSSVAWQAIGDQGGIPDTSSWTLGGSPVPFVPAHDDELLPEMLRTAVHARRLQRHHRSAVLHLTRAYGRALDAEPAAVQAAAIPVERIAADLLLVSGDDDQVWPSGRMAEALLARRRDAGVGAGDRHVALAGAGHLLRLPHLPSDGASTGGIALGGTPLGQGRAEARLGELVLAVLGGRPVDHSENP